jgi:hypothetical protein
LTPSGRSSTRIEVRDARTGIVDGELDRRAKPLDRVAQRAATSSSPTWTGAIAQLLTPNAVISSA